MEDNENTHTKHTYENRENTYSKNDFGLSIRPLFVVYDTLTFFLHRRTPETPENKAENPEYQKCFIGYENVLFLSYVGIFRFPDYNEPKSNENTAVFIEYSPFPSPKKTKTQGKAP